MDTESFESLLYFREQVLKSVDLERVDALRHDRDARAGSHFCRAFWQT